MKKIILASVAASCLLANSDYQITPMIGYVDTRQHVDLKDHAVAGIAATKNLDDSIFNGLELGLLQSGNVDYDKSDIDTKITQLFVNGVKDYKIDDSFKLYALAGLGYERLSEEEFGNHSDPFFNYGVGAGYSFSNDVALKLDARHQLKFDGDKNIVYILGLSIPLGGSSSQQVELDSDNDGVVDSIDKCPTTKANVAVDANGCELDSDNDGVADSIDKCPTTEANVAVDANGCELDDDNDGVVDSKDKCLETPKGEAVNENGCPIVPAPATLGIIFETNSAKIQSSDISKFEKFVTYLKSVPTSNIVLEGHTDSIGDADYNLKLSQKRAESTKAKLVSMGISADRITAIGYGETKPLVENNTAENRKQNRRVTARIAK